MMYRKTKSAARVLIGAAVVTALGVAVVYAIYRVFGTTVATSFALALVVRAAADIRRK